MDTRVGHRPRPARHDHGDRPALDRIRADSSRTRDELPLDRDRNHAV